MEQKNMILKNRVGSKKNASHYGYTVQFTVMTLYFSKKRKNIGNDIVLQLLELEVC